jgi:hypothetical protein
MGRADYKRGRFTAGQETRSINAGLRGYQSYAGDQVEYWRFDHADSVMDDVYDEATGAGRVFYGPYAIPVLHVVHLQGEDTAGGTKGFYTNDTLSASASFRQVALTGMTLADIRTNAYLRDRLVYDEKAFRVTRMTALGQIQRADLILAIECQQLKADEIVDDAQFRQWAVDPNAVTFN